MAIATRVLSLSTTPVDLTALADIAAAIAARGSASLVIQNTGIGKTVVLAEQALAPAAGSRDGFVLKYSDSASLEAEPGSPIWGWSTTTATLAISQGVS